MERPPRKRRKMKRGRLTPRLESGQQRYVVAGYVAAVACFLFGPSDAPFCSFFHRAQSKTGKGTGAEDDKALKEHTAVLSKR
jgi:hypothetical protein